MFYHLNLVRKVNHEYGGVSYEIAIYRAKEDGHLRGYISAGGFSDRIAELPGTVAYDMKSTGAGDPIDALESLIKAEIDAGKFTVLSAV